MEERINALRSRAITALEKMEPEKMSVDELERYAALLWKFTPIMGIGTSNMPKKED